MQGHSLAVEWREETVMLTEFYPQPADINQIAANWKKEEQQPETCTNCGDREKFQKLLTIWAVYEIIRHFAETANDSHCYVIPLFTENVTTPA